LAANCACLARPNDLVVKESIPVNFQQFSIFPKNTPNFGVFAKNLSKVRLRKLSLFCSTVSPSWTEKNLVPLLLSWYKLIVDLFWQALVKLILRTLERDMFN